MRKFLVCYRIYFMWGEYEYNTYEVVLHCSEKANVETFENKLNELGDPEILAWSLIEE